MNVRIFALCFALAAVPAFAQKASDAATKRAAMIQSLQRGKAIVIGNEHYRHLPEVLAVERAGGAVPGGPIIETKGGLVLYRAATTSAALVQRAGGAPIYPTVLNTRTGALGVLTGTLIVKPRNMSDADAIASSYKLTKSKVYPQLQTVFYKAGAGVDIADVSAALQADPRVETAYPEIIERIRVPK